MPETRQQIDDEYSKRPIKLDPCGYFVIFIDRQQQLICAKYFINAIDDKGRAIDPDTGKVIPAKGTANLPVAQVFTGRTAKELCIKICELAVPCPVTLLDHACYLGREAQKAEFALANNSEYLQD